MPHYNIHLRIVCGETTCAVVAGRFCEHCDWSPVPCRCAIFGDLQVGPGGWVLRHPACITASQPAEKPKGSA